MRKTIHADKLIEDAVEAYRIKHSIKSWSEAASELLVKGILTWQKSSQNAPQWDALKKEYDYWLGVHVHNYDPAADQDGEYNFERFVTRKVTPNWGGKRKGSGRKS